MKPFLAAAAPAVLVLAGVLSCQERPVVLGTGNRLSGRMPVLYVGNGEDAPLRALQVFASAVARRSHLRMEVRRLKTYGSEPVPAAFILLGRVPSYGEAKRLRHYVQDRCGVVGMVTRTPDPGSLHEFFRKGASRFSRLVPGTGEDPLVRDVPEAPRGVNPEILAVTYEGQEHARLLAASSWNLEALLLVLFRNAILHGGGVRHVSSAFESITGHLEEDRLNLVFESPLPGKVRLSLLTLEGTTVVPEGPVRPVPVVGLDTPEDILVRLGFWGEEEGEGGLREEVRLWLPDLVPDLLPGIQLHGPVRVPAGKPVRYDLTVMNREGSPIPGCDVSATLSGQPVSTVTDAMGCGWLTFPPFPPDRTGTHQVRVKVTGSRFTRTLEARIQVTPRPKRVCLETDRPLYRPGGTVQFRVIAVDGITRCGLTGVPVKVEVKNPAGKVLAQLECTTGPLGAAGVALPLADELPEGEYHAHARAGTAAADVRFRVETFLLPRFKVEVILEKDCFTVTEPIRGTVHAATFSGEPLKGAAVLAVLLPGGEGCTAEGVLDDAGKVVFQIPPSTAPRPAIPLLITVDHQGATVTKKELIRFFFAQKPRIQVVTRPAPLLAGVAGTITFRIQDSRGNPVPGTVEWTLGKGERRSRNAHGGEVTVSLNEIPAPGSLPIRVRATVADGSSAELKSSLPVVRGLALTAPDLVPPGARIPVEVRATVSNCPVILELSARGRLLAGASAVLRDGRASMEIPVPGDVLGPALLRARAAGDADLREGRRHIDVVSRPVTVTLETDRCEARPGDRLRLRASVTDVDGKAVPALLDVRGYDRAYLESSGEVGPTLAEILEKEPEENPPALLAGTVGHHARTRVKAGRAVRTRLLKGVESLGRGRPARFPWGAPIHLTRLGKHVGVAGDPPVTAVPEGSTASLISSQVVVARGQVDGTFLPVVTLLPGRGDREEPPEPPGISGAAHRGDWLPRCQDSDGAFRVLNIHALHGLGPEESPGDPWLEPGCTGLTLLAFLGAGYTHEAGKYKDLVRAGLGYLQSVQGADGFLGDQKTPWALLNHAMCCLALAEAHGMTRSPWVQDAARKALSALAARQRADGGFTERSWTRGSLVLATWAVAAFRSGRRAGLEVAPRVFEGLARWVDARTRKKTGEVRPCREEILLYPFSATDRDPHPAAMTAYLRIFLGKNPDQDPILQKLGTILSANLPDPDRLDLHGMYWGTMASFQFGGRRWAQWNRALKSVFSRGAGSGVWQADGYMGRVAATSFVTLCQEVYYRYGKTFGRKEGKACRVRRDFPDLMISAMHLRTDAGGGLDIPLVLPDTLTHWDLRVGAWDGRGGYGMARKSIRSTLPIHIEMDLPGRLFAGDRVRVPVRIRSRLSTAVTAALEVAAAEGFTLTGKVPGEVKVEPGGTALVWLDLEAARPGPVQVLVKAAAGPHRDAVERKARIVGRGVPITTTVVLQSGRPVRPSDHLPGDVRSVQGRVRVSDGPLGDAEAGLRALIQRPTGCFEQTSATLYPALLALQYIERIGRSDAKLSARARTHLLSGYQKLLAYEVKGGGFSLYGNEPARPDLTALGLHLLLDLKNIQAVDRGVLERAARFLERNLPQNTAAGVYALAALKRAGRASFPKIDLDTVLAGRDVYPVVLAAAHGLFSGGESTRVRMILEASAKRKGGRVFWQSDHPTLFTRHRARDRVEITALAVLALKRLEASPDLVNRGLREIRRMQWGDGAWCTTRETVVCLRTLLEVEESVWARGAVVVKQEGRPDRTFVLSETSHAGTIDLGPVDRDTPVEVLFKGSGKPVMVLVLEEASTRPLPSEGPMTLQVKWPEGPHVPGATCTVEVEVGSKDRRTIHAPLVEIPVPAGFRPDRRALESAARGAGFGRAEVKAGYIYLYLEDLRETVRIEIPFTAGARGRFYSGTARAWPYYTPGAVSHHSGKMIRVGGK